MKTADDVYYIGFEILLLYLSQQERNKHSKGWEYRVEQRAYRGRD